MLDWTFTQLRRDSASNGKTPFKEEYKVLKCELRFGAFFNLHILNGKIKYIKQTQMDHFLSIQSISPCRHGIAEKLYNESLYC